MNMEEIGLAAKAYYKNCSNEIRKLPWKIFQSIDTNREGRVSVDKFTNFIQNEDWTRLFHNDTGTDGDDNCSKDYAKLCKWVVDSKFFTQLDTNGDGSLDLFEFRTFLYLLSTRHIWCSGCQANLPGMYFTCLDCFDCDDTTFDLCVACYNASRFSHHHNRFVDSFVLLRSKTKREVNRAAAASCSDREGIENENGQEDIDCAQSETSLATRNGEDDENGQEEYPAPGQNSNGMDLFHNNKVVRLRSYHEKYLFADEDKESVIQSRNGLSENAEWTVEFVPSSSSIIRLRSSYGKYLTASGGLFLLGMTGRKVLQTLPIHLESSVEWEPVVIDGSQVQLKNCHGDSLLRANAGSPPWRNTVTHEVSSRSSKDNWMWHVDIVEKQESEVSRAATASCSNGEGNENENGQEDLNGVQIKISCSNSDGEGVEDENGEDEYAAPGQEDANPAPGQEDPNPAPGRVYKVLKYGLKVVEVGVGVGTLATTCSIM